MLSFHALDARMFTKMHFPTSPLDYFPQNCDDYNEDRGERFHQDICMMEEQYQGHLDINILVDCCWGLKRDTGLFYCVKGKLTNALLFVFKSLVYTRSYFDHLLNVSEKVM